MYRAILVALAVVGCSGQAAESMSSQSDWTVSVERIRTTTAKAEEGASYGIGSDQFDVPGLPDPWRGLYVSPVESSALGRPSREVWLPGNPVALATVSCDDAWSIASTTLTSGEVAYRVTVSCEI